MGLSGAQHHYGLRCDEVTGKRVGNRESGSRIPFALEVAKRSLFISTGACLFVDGIARPGAMIQDFSPEDIEAIERYAAPTPCGVAIWLKR